MEPTGVGYIAEINRAGLRFVADLFSQVRIGKILILTETASEPQQSGDGVWTALSIRLVALHSLHNCWHGVMHLPLADVPS